MTTAITVPALPESVADATLINWTKKPGDPVHIGENLVDLETDKVVLELPAPVSGILKQILAQDGTTVTSGDTIAYIEEGHEADAPAAAALVAAASTPAAAKAATPTDDKTLSPAARKIAAENGVTAGDVTGSGKGGRITKADIRQHLAGSNRRHEERVPMTRLRKRIAERLLDAQHNAAMLTTFNEVNMAAVMKLRKTHQDAFFAKNGVKLGFMSFFVKAAVAALKKYPAVNASIDGDDIIYHNYCDIGIAVSSPRGLVVPILRNAEHMGFADIEQQIIDYAGKAKDGSLTIEEMTGGTFTITNGGTFGSMMSTPIINPPQSGILGMHNIVERPIAENGQVVIAPMMYIALSYDHRIIDGREAVGFLVEIKQHIEDPTRLVLGL
ncbi:2-oxoglutarate dehydrogenase complex dihydrolipoyllysine-residue succinyltransferase [Cardiobacterium valvarum]|uniref:Dihydrolipoyllysine-residue succinyltransferase component of 2-oxoglutarate dehydrogenase complex n=1 Tax=Cardiobacterium valvarum F0432 TaxID=797473 RepID=G9ZJG4_9GAMM|nr:2-oxoglutarate dehydrogenase complex dihydrolipoyllysine-residue succinyltransferase [Cardiobacterium valvarum]EHM49883.1 dihydrolipoyllysine-residue succinyltransferase, E2 component of oxoglutarate dehydrogenase complex [Cardiobacterium valvarum F0432]